MSPDGGELSFNCLAFASSPKFSGQSGFKLQLSIVSQQWHFQPTILFSSMHRSDHFTCSTMAGGARAERAERAEQAKSGPFRLKELVSQYIQRALSEAGSGMKALLLDDSTAGIVGCAFSQSQGLQHEVFLTQTLDHSLPQPLPGVKAIVLARPSHQSIHRIRSLLSSSPALFPEAHIFFTNITRDGALQDIADADSQCLVQQVQEFFIDYVAIDPHHFTLDIRQQSHSLTLAPPNWAPPSQQQVHDRIVEGVASALLSLRRRPVVRYQRKSASAQRIAQDVHRLAYDQEAGLFDFRRAEGLVLLVVDRLDDPVTPLLSQWTYKAMVHELLGIHLNRVDLSGTSYAQQLKQQQQSQRQSAEVVLDEESDNFYRENMHGSYGELGNNLKQLVDDFQQQSQSKQNVQTIEDMQRFVESYPEFRAKQTNVSKHVALMTELSRIVDDRHLMRVSQCEQELACGSDRSSAYDETASLVRDRSIRDADKLRLVILFALRYERESPRQVRSLCDLLSTSGVPAKQVVSDSPF
jgi:vacuolar protein sorting-associated protein 45